MDQGGSQAWAEFCIAYCMRLYPPLAIPARRNWMPGAKASAHTKDAPIRSRSRRNASATRRSRRGFRAAFPARENIVNLMSHSAVGVAQLVERRSVAPNVAGSIPVSHPNPFFRLKNLLLDFAVLAHDRIIGRPSRTDSAVRSRCFLQVDSL